MTGIQLRRQAHVPTAVDHLGPYVDAGVLEAAEVELAATLARLAPGTAPEVLLAAALAARGPRLGHTCADLDHADATLPGAGLDPNELATLPWPDRSCWDEVLRAASSLVAIDRPDPVAAAGATVRPLVWDGRRLTLDRYARYERALAAALVERAGSPGRLHAEPADLDLLFGPPIPGQPDHQRAAAELALARRLAVVAGGPGTGKTRTVARLLAVVHLAATRAGRPIRVALAAPTGKAAARLDEAVALELATTALPHDVAARVRAAEASTIHRLLGYRDGIRFRHDAGDPLPHDLVIVDETSMASLPLLARLVAALRPDAHLVLVGDPDQLASVEAGAVLTEVVAAAAAAPPGHVLAGAVATLERAHRFTAGSPIGALAERLRHGDAVGALALLRDPGRPELTLVAPASPAAEQLAVDLAAQARQVIAAARAGEAEGALAAASATKVLAATRSGSNAGAAWQARIETHLGDVVDLDRRWYVGRPVLVTRNDEGTGLFNGDVGVVVATPDGPTVALRTGDGLRWLAPGRLGDHETWWAMTIHKSQGSELDHAVVALPDAPSPMLTRELLYTAATRARRRVTVVADEAAFRLAASTRVPRASSLADLLLTGGGGG